MVNRRSSLDSQFNRTRWPSAHASCWPATGARSALAQARRFDPLQFAVWLQSLRPFLQGSSWRVYRNAAVAAVQILPHENQSAAVTMLAEDGRRRAIHARQVDGRTLRKEGNGIRPTRATRIAYSDYEKLVRLLPTISRVPATDWLRDWLIAGVSSVCFRPNGRSPNWRKRSSGR